MAERTASPPSAGAARDAVRTLIGFGLFMLLAKVVGDENASQMGGAVEAVVVVITSAIFAFIGKKLRNNSNIAGDVV